MTEDIFIGSPEHPKTAGLVSYLTFIGWLVAYFALYGEPKNAFSAYHLRQTLLLHIVTAAVNIIIRLGLPTNMLSFIISSTIAVALFILWLIGVIHAAKGEMKPIPIIGKYAQKLFPRI